MKRNIQIEALAQIPLEKQRIEVVERKGIGHPDTICDALAPSVLWITFTFAGVIALNRSFVVERENAALDGLLLAPVSRSAIFLGKYLANLAFVFTVEAVTLPLFVLFFGVDLTGSLGGIALTAVLATAGFVAVGTVFAAMTVRTRFAELMLPLLILPFLVPPVIGAV